MKLILKGADFSESNIGTEEAWPVITKPTVVARAIEIATEAEMDTILVRATAANINEIYLYVGETVSYSDGTPKYVNNSYYIIEGAAE